MIYLDVRKDARWRPFEIHIVVNNVSHYLASALSYFFLPQILGRIISSAIRQMIATANVMPTLAPKPRPAVKPATTYPTIQHTATVDAYGT